MTFEWMVARRYLAGGRAAQRDRFLSVITWIAILAVATGVAALVLALAINAGFRETYEEQLLGATAHVNLARKDAGGIRDYEELAARLRPLAGVTSVSPALYETVLISSGNRARGIVLKGIRLEDSVEQEKLFTRWREGRAALGPSGEGPPALVIGYKLAQELGVFAGDAVMITSPQGQLTPFGLVPRYRSFRVVGVFESGFWDFDAGWAFTRLDVIQQLLSLRDTVSLLEIRLTDIYAAEEVSRQVEAVAGEGFVATPWMEMHQSLFRVLRLEKLVTALFIGLIVLVAGLNILILLVMLVLEKRREIAVLLSLGARAAQVQRIFILHGVAIGALGTLLGLILGFTIAMLGGRYRLFPLDAQIYGIPYVPFRASALDGCFIAAVALLISLAATIYPARRATHVHPVEVLRYE